MTLNNLNAYGPGFQIKVLSSLLNNKEFLINIHDILSEEYFDNQAHKWVVGEILKYYDKYHTTPTLEVLKVELARVENEVLQVSIKEQLRDAINHRDTDSEFVEGEFSDFCKNQQLKKALLSSVDLLKAGDYDSIKIMIENALKAGQDKNLGHEYEKDIEDRYRNEQRATVPTPWPQFNEILQGGLGNGDFGLIFGNPGGGKSWSLVALGGHAIKMGYNVIHYTLELGEEYVGKRYDAFFTKISVSDIGNHKEKVAETLKDLPGKLIIKEFATGKASVSTVESHIGKCIDLGMKPDLVIIDYVDLLKSKKTNRERKDEIDDIYLSTKGLARQLDIPIWSVSQVNRQGAQDDIIEGHKAAGSYDKMMVTDFAASLSRKKEDKINGTGRWHIMKNRYGMDGLTFGAKADVSTGTFEIIPEDELDKMTPTQPQSYINEGSTNFSLETKQTAAQFLNNI
tara:strand:+ start:990 stop:2354 length:1365 start_codon:yes stop_codon:yes gene_type:complete